MKFLLALVFIVSLSLSAEEIDYTINPSFPFEGKRFELRFDFQCEIVKPPVVQGWKYLGTSSNRLYNNGVYTRSDSLTYGAYKHGTYTIPPFTITANGKPYTMKAKTLKIWPEDISCPDDKVIITKVTYNGNESLPEKIYPGVVLKVNYEINTLLNWRNISNDLRQFPECKAEGLNVKKYVTDSGWVSDRKQSVAYKVIDGLPYRSSVYSYSLAPLKVGSYDFDLTHEISTSLTKRGQLRGKRLNGSFKLNKTIIVNELPAPPNGVQSLEIVGKWQLRFEVSKKKVKTGHTFELRIFVEGSGGDIARIKAPDLEFPGIEVDPVEIIDIKKGKMITYAMRALRPDAQLGNLAFATFDDEKGEFVEHVLKPKISFTGKALDDMSITEPIQSRATVTSADQRNGLKLGASSLSRPLYFNVSPLWYFFAFFLPLVFLILTYCRNRDKKAIDIQKEARRKLKLICQELAIGSNSDIIGKELIPCLAQYYKMSPGITADELAGQLEDKQLAELILENSHNHFLPGNGQGTDRTKLVARLKPLLIISFLFILPVRAGTLETQAVDSFRNKDYIAAESLFLKLADQDNADPNTFYNLGLSRLAQNKLPSALASFETAGHLMPGDRSCRKKINEIKSRLKVNEEDGFFGFIDQLRPDQWLQVSLLCWSVFWLVLIGQFMLKGAGKRWTALLGLVLTLLCVIPYFVQANSSYKKGQYIALKKSQTYTSSNIAEKTSIELQVGQGLQMTAVEKDCIQIEVNGRRVWVPAQNLMLFW